MLRSHGDSIAVAKDMKAKIVGYPDVTMSCYNWHPGSISVINQTSNFRTFAPIFPKNKAPAFPVPEAFTWVKPIRQEFVDLLAEIQLTDPAMEIKNL